MNFLLPRFFLIGAATSLLSASAFAVPSLWNNPAGGELTDPANWAPDPVVGAGTDGDFSLNSTYEVTVTNSVTAWNLNITTGEVTLKVAAGQVLTFSPTKTLTVGGKAIFDGLGTIDASAGTVQVNSFVVGPSLAISNGEVQGGIFAVLNGSVSQTSGTVTSPEMLVGTGAGNVGVYELNDGTIRIEGLNLGGAVPGLRIGDFGGTGTFNQNGGTVLAYGPTSPAPTGVSINIGNQGGTGTYNISGGLLSVADTGFFTLGRSTGGNAASRGTLNISGNGTVDIGGTSTMIIGDFGNSMHNGFGTVNQTGGILRIANTATLNLSGYTPTIAGTNTYNLSGGVLEIGGTSLQGAYQNNGSPYRFNLSGGTILVSGSDLITSVNARVTGQDSTIDTNGYDANWSGVLSGNGELIKTGSGTLELSGANTFGGTLRIFEDNVKIANASALGTSKLVFRGDMYDATLQTTANMTLANDIVVRPGYFGGLVPEAGTKLTLTGNLTLNGGWFGIGNSGTVVFDPASIQANNNTVFEVAYGATARAKSDTLSDDLTSVAYATIVSGVLDFNNKAAKIKNLLGDGKIDLGTSNLRIGNGIFVGKIVGAGSVTKYSNNTLYLAGNNTYDGGTTINQGTLITVGYKALAAGDVTLKSGGTLAPYGGLKVADFNWNGGDLLIDPNYDILDVTGTMTITDNGQRILISDTFADPSVKIVDTLGSGTIVGFNNLSVAWANPYLTGSLVLDANSNRIRVRLDGPITSDSPTLSNTVGPVTPVTANFIVDPQWGIVDTLGFDNIVNSLAFLPNGWLRNNDNLSVTSGQFTVADGTGTLSGGPVITPGGFFKSGNGTLNLLASLIVSGNANIQSGTLSVNGSLTASQILVQFAAWLKGSGIINGNVFNNGTIAPGNSPGTLTVNGNVAQSSSGTLQIEVADNAFDQLIVSGRASLAGTLQAIAFGGHQFQYGDQVPFLRAGSISGDFDNIVMTNPSKFRGRFITDGGVGSLVVAPTSYTLVAQNQNQKNVAKALDSFIGASGDKDTISTALDIQTENQYGNAFDQISPGFYQSLTDMVIEQMNAQNQMLAQRLSAVRLGVGGFSVVGLDQAALTVDRDGKSVMDAKSEKDIINPANATKWSVFVQGNGIFARVMNVSQVPNYRFNSGGFIVGADYTFGGDKTVTKGDGKKAVVTTEGSSLTVGLYGGYQGTYARYANNGRMTINSAVFGTYASFSNGGFYSDLIVGGSYNGYRASRPIDFSTVDRTARSSPDGGTVSAYLDAGYDFHAGNFTFGPLLSGQYIYAGSSAFTESGADSLDLRGEQQNANSLRTNIGGRIAYTWQLTDSITLVPEGRMFWQHEYLNGTRNIGASLDGGSGPSVDFNTSDPSRDSVFVGAGVSANFGDCFSTYFYYNADFGRQDFVSHMISGGLNWKF